MLLSPPSFTMSSCVNAPATPGICKAGATSTEASFAWHRDARIRDPWSRLAGAGMSSAYAASMVQRLLLYLSIVLTVHDGRWLDSISLPLLITLRGPANLSGLHLLYNAPRPRDG